MLHYTKPHKHTRNTIHMHISRYVHLVDIRELLTKNLIRVYNIIWKCRKKWLTSLLINCSYTYMDIYIYRTTNHPLLIIIPNNFLLTIETKIRCSFLLKSSDEWMNERKDWAIESWIATLFPSHTIDRLYNHLYICIRSIPFINCPYAKTYVKIYICAYLPNHTCTYLNIRFCTNFVYCFDTLKDESSSYIDS